MRILVVGTHPEVRQPSMVLFASWLTDAAKIFGEVTLARAPATFLTADRRTLPVAKWLAYLDQYVLLTLLLWHRHRRFDAVLVADQGNAPSALLVPKHKLIVMVHDTIAIRQALGEIAEAPRLGRGGSILQAWIRYSIRRARALLSNPGTIPDEIERLGLGKNIAAVGCPADYSRLEESCSSSPVTSPYVLNVASDGWRKRKLSLIPLWLDVQRQSDLRLVLAGSTDDETYRAFLAAGVRNVVIMNDVPDATLAALYKNCVALISSSHEEGLCIPILEALHFEKRVFTPAFSPNYADFFGSAVTRLDFEDPASAADQMMSALSLPLDLDAVRRVQAWANPSAFKTRVAEALASALQTEPVRSPTSNSLLGTATA